MAIELPKGCEIVGKSVVFRAQNQNEPDTFYQRSKSYALGLVTKLALAVREEWKLQKRSVPPKEQLRFRSGQQRIKRDERWRKQKAQREEEERWRLIIQESDRRREERDRKERERIERDNRKKEREREDRERKRALAVEWNRRNQLREQWERDREEQEIRDERQLQFDRDQEERWERERWEGHRKGQEEYRQRKRAEEQSKNEKEKHDRCQGERKRKESYHREKDRQEQEKLERDREQERMERERKEREDEKKREQERKERERKEREDEEKREQERKERERKEREDEEKREQERKEKERKEREGHEKLELERKAYEKRLREQREREEDELSIFGHHSFRGVSVDRPQLIQKPFVTIQQRKERQQKLDAERDRRKAHDWYNKQSQAVKDRIDQEQEERTGKYDAIEAELHLIGTRGERFHKRYVVQEELSEVSEEEQPEVSENDGVREDVTERVNYGAGCSRWQQPNTALSAVSSSEDDRDYPNEDDRHPNEDDRDHPNTAFSAVSSCEKEEEVWKGDADIVGTMPLSQEHKYHGYGKGAKKRLRRLEREGTVEKELPETRQVIYREVIENLEKKEAFLIGVIQNTFDFGGGSQRRDADGKRYTYRTLQQIAGSSGTSGTHIRDFCKKRKDLFKVTGERIELVKPGRKPDSIEVKVELYTRITAMNNMLKQLVKKEKVFGVDAEFYSYNIYDKRIYDKYEKSVQRDIETSGAKVSVSQVIGRSKTKFCERTGRRRLAVERGIRLVQIYSELNDRVYIFFLERGEEQKTMRDSGLQEFFEDKAITKFVVGTGDVELLQNRHFFNCAGFVDLQRIASACIRDVIPISTKMTIGSNVMAVSCGINKPLFQSCSELCRDPENKTLGWMFDCITDHKDRAYRRDLLQYAGYDAYAALMVGDYLLEKLNPSSGSRVAFELEKEVKKK
jgi:hypothetical protein